MVKLPGARVSTDTATKNRLRLSLLARGRYLYTLRILLALIFLVLKFSELV